MGHDAQAAWLGTLCSPKAKLGFLKHIRPRRGKNIVFILNEYSIDKAHVQTQNIRCVYEFWWMLFRCSLAVIDAATACLPFC